MWIIQFWNCICIHLYLSIFGEDQLDGSPLDLRGQLIKRVENMNFTLWIPRSTPNDEHLRIYLTWIYQAMLSLGMRTLHLLRWSIFIFWLRSSELKLNSFSPGSLLTLFSGFRKNSFTARASRNPLSTASPTDDLFGASESWNIGILAKKKLQNYLSSSVLSSFGLAWSNLKIWNLKRNEMCELNQILADCNSLKANKFIRFLERVFNCFGPNAA